MKVFSSVGKGVTFVGLLVSVMLLAGCAVASVGGDASGELFSTATALIRAGKCEAFVVVPWGTMVAGVQKTAGDLALTPIKEERHPEQRKLIYEDDRKQAVVVTVVRRTKDVTELRVDVGMIGAEGLGKLMLEKILANTGAQRSVPVIPVAPPATNTAPAKAE